MYVGTNFYALIRGSFPRRFSPRISRFTAVFLRAQFRRGETNKQTRSRRYIYIYTSLRKQKSDRDFTGLSAPGSNTTITRLSDTETDLSETAAFISHEIYYRPARRLVRTTRRVAPQIT